MSQCVPRWNVDEPPPNSSSVLPLRQCHPAGDPIDPLDYEVAELTWENGQLAFHGLVPPRTGKPTPKHPSPSVVATAATTSWNKHHRSGTLESVVHQATGSAPTAPDLDDWFSELRRSAAVAVDAIVPCRDDVADNGRLPHPDAPPRADSGRKRVRTVRGTCSSQGSAAGFLARHVDSTTLVTLNGSGDDEIDLIATAATATNSNSPGTEITSLGKRKTLDLDDHVSLSHTSSQTKHDSLYDEEEKATKRDVEKPSASANKSKATAIHNQSERKRRDRINQKIKTLQKLVPNSSKTDKASMLDEVIEYLKQLQAQAQMMSRMNQYRMLPMAMIAHMNLPQMGMGVGMMDLNPIGRPTLATLPPLFQYSSGFLPLATGDQRLSGPVLPDPYSTFLACQMAQQPVSFDEYSRMAALLHQHWPQA